MKRATVGPLPGVTQDIAGYKVKCSTFLSLFYIHVPDKSRYKLGLAILRQIKGMDSVCNLSELHSVVFFLIWL